MDELEELLAERAIMRALHAYAHAMDYGDEAAWVDVFTEDAVFDVVEVVGGRRVHREEGRADLAAYVAAYPKPPHFRKHIVVDPMIDVDGDTAKVEAYWLLLERNDDNGRPVLSSFGHYDDRWVKQGGRWRIAHRYAEVEASNY
jgi:ketosteroid isomerase-like protein